MEWPADAPTIIAISGALVSVLVACMALTSALAMRRRVRGMEEALRRIETGRTKALSSAEHLLSAMHRLAAGYRWLALSMRTSSTVVPESVQEIETARQEVERERAVANLYWPEGVAPHIEEVAAITDGVAADAKLLEEKADKIEQHGSETAKLFKARYLQPAA